MESFALSSSCPEVVLSDWVAYRNHRMNLHYALLLAYLYSLPAAGQVAFDDAVAQQSNVLLQLLDVSRHF